MAKCSKWLTVSQKLELGFYKLNLACLLRHLETVQSLKKSIDLFSSKHLRKKKPHNGEKTGWQMFKMAYGNLKSTIWLLKIKPSLYATVLNNCAKFQKHTLIYFQVII